MKISNFIFTVSLLVITSFSNAQQIAIIPEPYQMKVGNGSYTLPKVVVVNAPTSASVISELISKKITAVTGSQVTKSSTKSNIDLQITNETELGKEGYHLDVNEKGIQIKGAKVLILGITFKENCPDIRNSKVADVVNELKSFETNVEIYDPHADAAEVKHEYGFNLINTLSGSLSRLWCYGGNP